MKKTLFLVLLTVFCLASAGLADMNRQIWDTGTVNENLAGVRAFHEDKRPDMMPFDPAPDIEDVQAESWFGDRADNYYANLWGWVTIPKTGDYTWHLHADNHTVLYISTDENWENVEEVASIDGWSNIGEWGGGADGGNNADSQPFTYTAGQQLAVWGILVEGGGGDNLGIGWTMPGASTIEYITDHVSIIPPAPTRAKNPVPGTDASDIPRDTGLAWDAGKFAAKHDVYFSSSYSDVNDATGTNPLGALVAPGTTTTTYDPGILAFDQTYYWRVDAVNSPPDSTLYRGDIWSFTIEPFAIPIENVTATASGANPGMGAENTVNGSGLNALDQHGTDSLDMWLTGSAGAWIQYDFDKPYKLHELLVWNSNQAIEAFLGFGAKEVTVEYTADGENWVALEGPTILAQAPGQSTYTANTAVALGGIMAQSIKLSIVSAHGLIGQSGLAEVRFMAVPVYPREPQPTDGSNSAGADVQVSWRSGREAVAHNVALSPDLDAIVNGTAPVETVSEAVYDAGVLDYGVTYHWQVTEVNDAAAPAAHAGARWSFATPEYGISDGFESYSADEGGEVYMTWWDGFGGDAALGGSTTGHIDSPFVETSIVNPGTGGGKSLPMFFDNNGGFTNIDGATSSPTYSEVVREFDGLDFTKGNAQVFALSYRGNPAGFVEDGGHITMSASGVDIWGTLDEFRYAYKTLNGDGSMIAQVQSLETVNDWSKAGVMIRDTLDAGSAFAMMVATGTNGITFQYRTLGAADAAADNGDRDAASDPAMDQDDEPVWVRLDRTGNDFNAYWSLDGANWSPSIHNPVNINMGATIYIGLAVTSHTSGTAATAEFSDVSSTGNVTGSFTAEVIGAEAMPSNESADPLYLIVEDSAGKTVTITHPDAAAVQAGTWQDWLIPMTEFTSLKENNIKAITIGVGYKNGAQTGGEGVLYIDDLRIGTPIVTE